MSFLGGVRVEALFGAIPSPSRNSLTIGPIELRAYGLMIALGVFVAVVWSQRRLATRDGDPENISAIALWAVPAGLIGARFYHVLTDWKSFRGRWQDVPAVWQGGLGIPGGLVAGVLVGVLVARRRGMGMGSALDVVVPTLPVAQAIGRFGNWFNQEVFGRPTDLPWGLEIEAAHRPPEYVAMATFHPTFLYEGVWNVALAAALVRVERNGLLRPGYLVALWAAGYGLGRLWVEILRVDAASLVLGIRVNIWMALLLIVFGAVGALRGRVAGLGTSNG